MKVIVHKVRPKQLEVFLEFDPFVVWLQPHEELIIERGDKLRVVASEVERSWKVDRSTARQLVAFWFALGERLALGSSNVPDWSKRELRAKPGRRYLKNL